MSTISINYIIHNNVDLERIESILNGLNSENHKIQLRFFDFSLSKNVEQYLKSIKEKPSHIKISVFNQDYEDLQNAHKIILEKIKGKCDSIALLIVYDNLILDNSLDKIDFDVLDDKDFGFVYSDYNINNIRAFLCSSNRNSELRSPFLFLSTKKLEKHILEEEPISIVYNNYAGVHISSSLCTIIVENER